MTPVAPAARTLDLRGVLCPLNWVKTRLALEGLGPGCELWVTLDGADALASVPRSAREEGHGVEVRGNAVKIVKAAQ